MAAKPASATSTGAKTYNAPRSYIAAPLQIGNATVVSVRAALLGVEGTIVRASKPEPAPPPSQSERIAFWNALSEWSNRNVAALEGELLRAAPAVSAGTAAGRTAG